jgi:hypothetical protein
MGCHTLGTLALGIVLQRHGWLTCLVCLAVHVGRANTVPSRESRQKGARRELLLPVYFPLLTPWKNKQLRAILTLYA